MTQETAAALVHNYMAAHSSSLHCITLGPPLFKVGSMHQHTTSSAGTPEPMLPCEIHTRRMVLYLSGLFSAARESVSVAGPAAC